MKEEIVVDQMSTENNSLYRSGKSRCGAERRNLHNASMCSIDISRKPGVFDNKISSTVTSPLMYTLWVFDNSNRNAFNNA